MNVKSSANFCHFIVNTVFLLRVWRQNFVTIEIFGQQSIPFYFHVAGVFLLLLGYVISITQIHIMRRSNNTTIIATTKFLFWKNAVFCMLSYKSIQKTHCKNTHKYFLTFIWGILQMPKWLFLISFARSVS